MKMTYKFDEPAVFVDGVHYFPIDNKRTEKGCELEGVFYDGKWREDTFIKSNEFVKKLLSFYIENVPHAPSTKIEKGHYRNMFGEVKRVEKPREGWIMKPFIVEDGENEWFKHDVYNTKKKAQKVACGLVTGLGTIYL